MDRRQAAFLPVVMSFPIPIHPVRGDGTGTHCQGGDSPLQRTRRMRAGAAFNRRCMLLALVLTLAGFSSGCQIIIGTLLSLGGRPLIDADFKVFTGKSLAEKGKKVVVICTAPENAKDVSSLDLDIIADVSSKFRQHDINVVEPHKIQSWIDDNAGGVEESDLIEIGRKFDANYIVHIKLDQFAYKEENSPNLFRGRTKAKLMVVQIDDIPGAKGRKRGRKIYDKGFSSVYPEHQPKSGEEISGHVFRKQYLERVSGEIAQFFYDHRPGEGF